jgi:hypothetical protein
MSGAKHTPELKPCPFCGGEGAHGHIRYPNAPLKDTKWEDGSEVNEAFFVNCASCGASVGREGIVGGYQKPEVAAKAWNTRIENPSAFREVFGELVEALDSFVACELGAYQKAITTLAKAKELQP